MTKSLLFLIFIFIGNHSEAFIFKNWGGNFQQSLQPQPRPFGGPQDPTTGRTGQTWGFPNRRPIVLPCDGSAEITKACDTFCKSIRATAGACVLEEQTCGCTGFVVSYPDSGFVSPQAPPANAIRVIPAPDLSQGDPNSNLSTTINTSGVTRDTLDSVTLDLTRSRRSRREDREKVIEGSGTKNTNNTCTTGSCYIKCIAHGYESCSAVCVGLSCYCRCPSLEKVKEGPATPDPLTASQKYQPEDIDLSNSFRPPPSKGFGNGHS